MAHSLAKFDMSVGDFVAWQEDPPDWLDVCLLHEHVSSKSMTLIRFSQNVRDKVSIYRDFKLVCGSTRN